MIKIALFMILSFLAIFQTTLRKYDCMWRFGKNRFNRFYCHKQPSGIICGKV